MAEQRAVGDADPLGDRHGGDRARVALCRQRQHGLDDIELPLRCRQPSARRGRGARQRHGGGRCRSRRRVRPRRGAARGPVANLFSK